MSSIGEFLRKHLEGKSIEEALRLELEADVLVKFGFDPGELVVLHPDRAEGPQVVPRSFLEAGR